MSKNSGNVNVNGGIGFWGLLQLALIVLKLIDVINWSWWVVLIPLWIEVVTFILAVIIITIMTK